MKSRFLITFLALGCIFGVVGLLMLHSEATAQSNCYTPACLQRTNCSHWPRRQEVTVLINAGDFNALEQQAVREAFTNWQNATGPDGNNSGVTFNFVTVTAAPALIAWPGPRRAQTMPGSRSIGTATAPSIMGWSCLATLRHRSRPLIPTAFWP
jgi:hypothetical protein